MASILVRNGKETRGLAILWRGGTKVPNMAVHLVVLCQHAYPLLGIWLCNRRGPIGRAMLKIRTPKGRSPSGALNAMSKGLTTLKTWSYFQELSRTI